MGQTGAGNSICLLMYEDTDGAKSVNSAYASMALAEAWQGRLIEELLADAGLDGDADDRIPRIEELLKEGRFIEAASAFNALQKDQVWIEEVAVGVLMPEPGRTLGYIV